MGLALYLGTLATSNINVSHELCHKNNLIDSFLGTATTSKNLYMHFPIHHLQTHHKYVATPLDPSSAALGQSIYSFLPQTVIMSWVHSL